MATHRNKKTDQVKKEEMNPSSGKEDRNYHQILANEGPSQKLKNSLPVQTNTTCNKARSTANVNNKGNSGSFWEIAANMVSRTRKTCIDCTVDEKADSVESSGEINETHVSLQGENRNGASTLKKRSEISKMSNCINVSCQNTQHGPPGMIHGKAKPNISIRRDLTILPNPTADGEHLQMVIDNTGDVSKQLSNSASLERRSIRLMKSRKEDVQECKRPVGGCNVPLMKIRSVKDVPSRQHAQSNLKNLSRSLSPVLIIKQHSQQEVFKEPRTKDYKVLKVDVDPKTRSVKDVSSREPAQSKSHNLSRSLSPALVIKQQSQQEISKEPRAKDYKVLKADVDPLRQDQRQQRKGSSGSKSKLASVRASKFKLDYRKTEDRDNKPAAYKTEIGVARVEEPVASAASSHNGNLMKVGKTRKSSPFPSPVSVSPSMSDTYICGPKPQRPQTTGRTRQKATARFRKQKRGVSTAECRKKANVVDKGDAHSKGEINDNVSGLPKSSVSGRDLKSETPPTAHSEKQDVHQRIRKPKLSGSAVSQQQISKDGKCVGYLKWNSSVKASDGIININTIKIAANRGNGSPKASMEENKQVKIPAVRRSPKGYSNTCEPFVSPQNIREARKGKRANTKQRVDKRENEIDNCKLKDCLLKVHKNMDSDHLNSERHAYEIVDQAAPSTNLVSLDALGQAVSPVQLICPRSRNDQMHIPHVKEIQSDVTNVNILPAIYFCWQKCTDQQLDEGSAKEDVQHVVSLDQGLSVFRQIMMDAISENTLYSQEYTLKQLISKDDTYSSNNSLISNNKKGIPLAGSCFQLTPRFKGTKSNQIVWSAESPGSSTLIGSFYGEGAHFISESRQTMLCPDQGDSGPLNPALGETLCGTNDIQTAINISKAMRNSIRRRMSMTSLWSSVTKGIIAFFLHPLEKPNIAYSDLGAETTDDNGTTVDALISFLDKGQSSHVVGQKAASLGQVTLKQTESPCSNLVTGKRLSPDKGAWNSDTSTQGERDTSSTCNITKSKLDPCENTKDSLQEALNTTFGDSDVDCSHASSKREVNSLADEMEIPEPPHSLREHISVVTNSHKAPSHPVELHFNNYRKDTTIGETSRLNKTTKECSHCNYSNARIEKSKHSDKTGINEVNNIPFSASMYESLEGPTKKPDCNSVIEMQNDAVSRAYHSDVREFIGHENCPDPDMCDLGNDADVELGARPSCYDTSSLKHYPHLMWTGKYSRSITDSEEQPVFASKCCTGNERAELHDINWQLHKTDQTKHNGCQEASVHVISCKGYFHEQGASAYDTSVDGFDCYISADGTCQDVCHTTVSQKFAPLAEDSLLGGNAKASSPDKTSPHMFDDVKGQDGSNVYVADDCGIIHKQSLSDIDIEVPFSPSCANDGTKQMGNFGLMSPHQYVRICSLLENTSPYNMNMQINDDDLFDAGGFFGEDYSESACRHDYYTTCIDGDAGSFDAFPPNAEDCAREGNHDHAIDEINSPKTRTTATSRNTTELSVNKLTDNCSKLADVCTAILNAGCKQNSSDVALLFNDQHGCFSDTLATRDTNSNTLETMIGTILSPRQQTGQNISTDDIVAIVSEASVSGLAPRKQSLQFLSIDSITRAVLALKQASTTHMSYLCSSQTATACSYLMRVGCSSPFAVTLSNLFTQQLGRNSQREIIDQCSSSVDARALDWKTEDAVQSHAYDEDGRTRISNDSLENGGVNSDVPKSPSRIEKYKQNEHEFASTSGDSSQLADVGQGQQLHTRKVTSLKERASSLPKTIRVNHASRTTNKTATCRRFRSLGASVASRAARSSSKRNNNASNSSQQGKNKPVRSDPCVSRIADTLPPNTCQSDEGQESVIFSNLALSSPPASRTAYLDKAHSSSESFESVFKRNSVYLKELASRNDPSIGQPKVD
ncbi:hypothetical protein BsWGS_18597 [Bradybaena similaris]